MKPEDIGEGHIYTNGKGRYRIVLERFKSPPPASSHMVRYRPYYRNGTGRMVEDRQAILSSTRGTKRGPKRNRSCVSSETSFARWARAEVLAEDGDGNSVPAHHDITNIEQSRAAR